VPVTAEFVEEPNNAEQTRQRILEVTREGVGRFGPRKLSLSDIAVMAGVSRPTLYRYFSSKDDLLDALALQDQELFDNGLQAALHGKRGAKRLEVALEYIVSSQENLPTRYLVDIEPTFVLNHLAGSLSAITKSLTPIFEQLQEEGRSRPPRGVSAADQAAAVARIAVSHFLWESPDPHGFLCELKAAANLR
jgi:AcrR family transcriptional regulator